MPNLIIDGSVWRGSELAQREDWLLRLSDAEVGEIRAAADRVESKTMTVDDPDVDGSGLPLVSLRMRGVRESLETGSGAVLIKGFPIDGSDIDSVARRFLAVAGCVGTAVSQSAEGERVFHVRDAGFAESDARTRGPNTRKSLRFHTDRCDVIAFMCVKRAKLGGENQLVSSSAVYNEIAQSRPDLLSVLMEPFWYQRHTVDLGNERAFCRQPIFSFTGGRFACSYLRVLIDRADASGEVDRLSDAQREAMDYLESVCERDAMQYRFYQEPGDVVLLNNWTTLHRRDAFVDYEEPELRRHLLRIWLSVPNSRPIDPMFRENFGATEAGALRGGMRASGG